MKTKAIVFLTIFFLASGTLSVSGQESNGELKGKRITIKMEKRPLGSVLRYLMENYDIPIGFEQSILDRNHNEYDFDTNLPAIGSHRQQNADGSIKMTTTSEAIFKADLHPITLNFENVKLKYVFDRMVEQMENYKWEINNGVINILPFRGRDERFDRLLGLKINKFGLEKGKTVEDITTNITLLPEFRSFIRENKLSFHGFRTGINFVIKAQYGRIVDQQMDFSNLTFRELLNKVTKVKKGGWILKWRYISSTTGKELIDIDI
ncbi:MAG TPA: hypothetical protein VK612_11850 [Pyrinomonadaceae bacterium]|nr:hypothetical protein [Pyrinomonadaceae bacterium]